MESNLASRAVPTLRVVGCGIDSLYLFWRVPLSAGELERLRLLKLNAIAGGRKEKLPEVMVGDQLLEMQPNAARAGPLLLHNDAMSVVLNPDPPEGMPTVMIDLSSWLLWQNGADAAVAQAQKVVWELAADQADDNQLTPRVTRMDLCLDVQGWKPTAGVLTPRRRKKDCEVYNEKLFTRGRAFDLKFRSRFESAEYGTKGSGISAMIYNKTLEMEVKGDKSWFEEVWKQSGNYQPTVEVNGETVKQDVIRLEFRIRREGFTEFRESGGVSNLDTWEEARAAIKGIWSYLTRFWLVMRGRRNKLDRLANAVDPFWQQVVDGGELHMGTKTVLRSKLDQVAKKCMQAFAGYLVLNHACRQWFERNRRLTIEETMPLVLEDALTYAHAAWGDPQIKADHKLKKWTALTHLYLLGEDVEEAA